MVQNKYALLRRMAFLSLLPLFSLQAHAGMNFSVYTVPSLSQDGLTLYSGATIQDNSTGCSHSTYSTSALINGPNSAQASSGPLSGMSGMSGMSASTSIAVNDNYGDYSFAGTVSYYCSCINNVAGAGGGMTAPLVHIKAHYVWNGYVYKRCNPQCTVCDALTLSFFNNWQYGLFDGAEINIGNTSYCGMRGVQQKDRCYFPDPIPGTNNCGNIGSIRFGKGTRTRNASSAVTPNSEDCGLSPTLQVRPSDAQHE